MVCSQKSSIAELRIRRRYVVTKTRCAHGADTLWAARR